MLFRCLALALMAALVSSKTVEYYWTITNFTQSPDGVQRYAFGINGVPGYNSSINVDIGDQLILSVTNDLSDPTSLHIHGLSQNGTNFMDGPVGITQCAIAPGRTYVYNFTVAGQSGTYWWHAHNKAHYMDGLRGPFIINDPDESKDYTDDVVIQLTDWYHAQSDDLTAAYLNGTTNPSGAEPIWDTGLMNGMGKYNCTYAVGYICSTTAQSNWTWTAEPNSVTRVRLINTAGFAAFLFQIDGHSLTVIEVDGILVQPYTVDMIAINIAQRYSLLVTANQASGNYLIRADMYHGSPWTISMMMPAGSNMNVTGILNYAGIAPSDPVMEVAAIDAPILLDDMQLVPVEAIEAPNPTSSDFTLLFEFTYQQMISDTYQKYYIQASTLSASTWNTDFISSYSPSANNTPVLIDSVQNSFLNSSWQPPAWANTIKIKRGQVVDIIVRNDDIGEHPFHLHGHSFWLLSKGVANNVASIPRTYDLTNPLRRDTVTVPGAPLDSNGGVVLNTTAIDGGEMMSNSASLPPGDEDAAWFGYAVLRFVADNPGVWLFHCHIEWHIEAGLVMTFIESLEDLQQLVLPAQTGETCKDFRAWQQNPNATGSSSSAAGLRCAGWAAAAVAVLPKQDARDGAGADVGPLPALDVDGNPLQSQPQSQPQSQSSAANIDYSSNQNFPSAGSSYSGPSNSNYSNNKRQRDFSPDDYRGRRENNYGYGGRYNDRGYGRDNNYSGGYSRPRLEDPATLDYLVPFRQFADYWRSKSRHGTGRGGDYTDDELGVKYREYREQFQSKTLWSFFNERKNDEWFLEKYHPTDSKPLRSQINTRKLSEALPFWTKDFSDGKFDGISFDASAGQVESAEDIDGFGGVDLKVPKPWELCALFLKSMPLTVSRSEVLNAIKDTKGFKWLVLSDPRSDKGFVRLGWIVFEEGTDLDAALTELNGKTISESFSLSLALQVSQPYRTRILPVEFNSLSRLEQDLANVRRLARSLDLEAGISEESGFSLVEHRADEITRNFPVGNNQTNPANDEMSIDDLRGAGGIGDVSETGENGGNSGSEEVGLVKQMKLRLDFLIEYLRRVHWYDYYSGIEAAGPEDFLRRSWVYLRSKNAGNVAGQQQQQQYPSDRKQQQPEHTRLIERLDSRVILRTLNLATDVSETPPWGGAHLLKLGGQEVEKYVDKKLDALVAEVDEEKFRCAECSKLFRGKEFVKKHLRGKHESLVTGFETEILFFNAYVRDPNRVHNNIEKPGGAGSMQSQSFPQGYGERGSYGQQQYGGGYYGRGGSSRGRGPPRDGRQMPVDPRSRKSYDDLDVAPVGDVAELNYD
ncbi:hypothetical protein HDU84_003340 [Entophlyctis sp. JEL0112]|nr:hypothetical protein HDU84_003340 [Entophlyctis sp. JEL0112]